MTTDADQAELELGEALPALRALGEGYNQLVNMTLKTIMELADNNPALSHAIAASAEARLRALNHYNLVTTIINDQAAEKKNEEKP